MMKGWSNQGERQKILEVQQKGKDTVTASNRQESLQRKRICSTSLSMGDRTELFDLTFNLTFLATYWMTYWKMLPGKHMETTSRV